MVVDVTTTRGFRARGREVRVGRPLILGVLNVTPDSFSDGGSFLEPAAARAQAHRLVEEGADLLDVGGESSRPGADPLPVDEELARVLPVLDALQDVGVPLSIDTYKPQVAAAALEHGCSIINDIGGGDDEMLSVAAEHGAAVIAMHMKGRPKSMQRAPRYDDVVGEVHHFLRRRVEAGRQRGVDVLVDPGIGFGKTLEHNLTLLAELERFRSIGAPIVVGTSRKSFLGKLLDAPDPGDRLEGTLASSAWSVARGADIVRVHDVRPMRRFLDVYSSIAAHREGSEAAGSLTEIRVDGVECSCHIGVPDEERGEAQTLRVDVVIRLEQPPGLDAIGETVDYSQVALRIRDVAAARRYRLVETLARSIGEELARGPLVRDLAVEVHKPGAARELDVGAVRVRWSSAETHRSIR